MTELHRSLAMNVKILRTRWGWSQAELAERSSLSVSYIGDIEAGVKWPAADKVELLAQAFKLRPYQLFLEPQDTLDYQSFLERRDFVQEMGEKMFLYWENRGR
jgi:transcriptional regulator with XRE-family HTH domain